MILSIERITIFFECMFYKNGNKGRNCFISLQLFDIKNEFKMKQTDFLGFNIFLNLKNIVQNIICQNALN